MQYHFTVRYAVASKGLASVLLYQWEVGASYQGGGVVVSVL